LSFDYTYNRYQNIQPTGLSADYSTEHLIEEYNENNTTTTLDFKQPSE
jgi:hypothetical protein